MAQIKLLQHFSIYCRELEPMHNFYVNVLGLPELPRPEFPFPGYWVKTAGRTRQEFHQRERGQLHGPPLWPTNRRSCWRKGKSS